MSNFHDLPYLALVDDVLTHGTDKTDRTGVGTRSVFGRMVEYDISDYSIPLLTTKKMHIPSIIHELLWYLHGTGNITELQQNGVRIWNEWADENGDLGPVYGVQWRNWNNQHIDQIANVIEQLKTDPYSRRMLVTAWNPGQLSEMALPPCHYSFQLYAIPLTTTEITNIKRLPQFIDNPEWMSVPSTKVSLLLNMRSNDIGLGHPFNIAQYSLLLRMICHVTNTAPGSLIYSGGDVHIYQNHIPQLKEQMTRIAYPSPTLSFARQIDSIDDFTYNDFIISDYKHHPTIKMKVAV